MIDRSFLEKYNAKPGETIVEHTAKLQDNLVLLIKHGYLKDEKLIQLVCQAIEGHDVGKRNDQFAQRLEKGYRFNPQKEVAHNVLSYFLFDLNRKLSKDDFYICAYAILNHHNRGVQEMNSNRDLIIKELDLILKELNLEDDENIRKEINKRFARTFNAVKDLRENPKAIVVKGLLHKCDYSASAGIPVEFSNDFLEEGMIHLMEKWRQEDDTSSWNALQDYCRENQDENLLITAPTGMGKTEAALWWLGNHKGFFVLPLKVAINAIYNRVTQEILENQRINERVALLHGDTLNIYQKNTRNNDFGVTNEEYDLLDYYNKSRQFSYPLTISTPDQLFDFVFKYPGYELKIAMLSYSKVIIDEIQTYSPDLLAYIIYGLQEVVRFGGKFAIVTATFPPFVKKLLQMRNREPFAIKFEDKQFSSSLKRHHLKVLDKEMGAEDIIRTRQLNPNRKCLVVCNTVKKAQELYYILEAEFPEQVHLLHSKFINLDRRAKEEAILEVGKTFLEGSKDFNNCGEIWVTTQIVEASLDIDFDYLFTELSDANSLFQRLGRCNRKGKKAIEQPNCYVYTRINLNLIIRGERGFIDGGMHALSKEAIEKLGDGIVSEEDKQRIIEDNFTLEKISEDSNSVFLESYRSHYRYVSERYTNENSLYETQKRFRNIISYDVIPESILTETYREEIEQILEQLNAIDAIYEKAREEKKYLTDKEKQELQLKTVHFRDELRKYVVPVGYYDVYPGKKSAINEELTKKIPERERIFVLKCQYDDKFGFKRMSKEEMEIAFDESAKAEDMLIDAFM